MHHPAMRGVPSVLRFVQCMSMGLATLTYIPLLIDYDGGIAFVASLSSCTVSCVAYWVNVELQTWWAPSCRLTLAFDCVVLGVFLGTVFALEASLSILTRSSGACGGLCATLAIAVQVLLVYAFDIPALLVEAVEIVDLSYKELGSPAIHVTINVAGHGSVPAI
ncbi:Aste57867_10124 [Aphanomyces stellatus]|uniref:Aste57867_10124 protein n=1 Tax=Aphanomyces stellatus TaxID=120398 RepID=A0A485KPM9_9STRA|nr:hypothetical protein As57867_010085 [Aphanomyces stellatus]VFT87000.1 Aste57867_10124 [Aphanomyces stellatus]